MNEAGASSPRPRLDLLLAIALIRPGRFRTVPIQYILWTNGTDNGTVQPDLFLPRRGHSHRGLADVSRCRCAQIFAPLWSTVGRQWQSTRACLTTVGPAITEHLASMEGWNAVKGHLTASFIYCQPILQPISIILPRSVPSRTSRPTRLTSALSDADRPSIHSVLYR
ncbi:hypothetical protein BP00DRAFT_160142 [Aspergillus indologenus CBS 114.80]|uniref:Uncharacterized protein n=1 Tax=Aspergillus indologenus CBS 114.80 TaxID=1450541 RepID=A0A2V5I6M2_9EURO|nr:hypothetical protein BP00DRAFT_160142 [Aspergillus indologenus CBS 114.80]